MSKSGANITASFDIAFRIGFSVCVLDFLNTAFFEIYILKRKEYNVESDGEVSESTGKLSAVYDILKWSLRGFLILIAFF